MKQTLGLNSLNRATTSNLQHAASDLVATRTTGCAAPLPLPRPKNLDAAKRAVQAIRQGIKVLGQQPGIGRPIEDMPDAFREWIIDFGDSGYVARYRLTADAVIILAVRHQKEVGY